ncbi:MAG: imidazole glycerol phosphate synthase, glutamine amidotransferase subunit [Lentisphaerae bacterium RIFOXYB12_FULL_65_16]|nr:MAG: imidazole glycerol phosphate synthase, glutamine amidotransferase subunit [Lentisphaerae bacterium RIFOXYA12_64_32]OGV84602.1 MAG: imidazole glycerol phosphate synthase, glutamine amidotransferase subunit [Lentisphaerae bacterium RIFOXYB12_FULL_65_16]
MIAIIDYKAGNLTSVASAVQALGHPCCITSDPAKIAAADRVIFPGVGAARAAMQNLRDMNLVDCLRALATNGKPFLGICLGYQILFEFSEEDNVECLGILPGRVVRFPQGMTEGDTRPLKIPQMGWNEARFNLPHPVAAGLAAGSEFYFVHSYYPVPQPDLVCATTKYGIDFASGAASRNLVAFQFHPEKSGRPGLKLLDNFCRWTPS